MSGRVQKRRRREQVSMIPNSPMLLGPITPEGRDERAMAELAFVQVPNKYQVFGLQSDPSCRVEIKVVQGAEQIKKMGSMMSGRRMVEMCRSDVGVGYIKDLFGVKAGERSFGFVAQRPGPRPTVVGFAIMKLYNTYGGGHATKKAWFNVKQRIAILDLICTDKACADLGRLLIASVARESRRLGASLLILEATAKAASYYVKFGFRRTPDDCSLRSGNAAMFQQLQTARERYATRTFDEAERFKADMLDERGRPTGKKYLSLMEAAAANAKLGGVWWKGYNRGSAEGNQTVIMSLCLSDGGPTSSINQVDWSTAAIRPGQRSLGVFGTDRVQGRVTRAATRLASQAARTAKGR